MKNLLTFFLLTCIFLSEAKAQATKGLSVVQQPTEQKPIGKTYALVVGVSKYKNPAIPSLQFADRDAIAFRNYLVASGVDSNNIILRINEVAKYADILMDCNTMCLETAKRGDKVFIYFSGHGDVESKVITNLGYLLPYDAPSKVYSISAIDIRILQDYVSTASANGVEVVVITDACHSGNLAGGMDGLTNIQNVLKDRWKDEVKILSCQPGELSLEGKQWGNGRGLFSYELIKGLAGEADKNDDGKVTLNELNLFLSNKVPDEAHPSNQYPEVVGSPSAVVSTVNKKYLAQLNSTNSATTFSPIAMKGNVDALLKNQTDSVKKWYALYQMNLDSGSLCVTGFGTKLITVGALDYLRKIPENENTKLLLGIMKRNLAAKMICSITETIDEVINNKTFISNGYFVNWSYSYLSELNDLIGQQKLKDLGLIPKMLYLQALNSDVFTKPNINNLKLLDSALILDKNASYVSALYSYIVQSKTEDINKSNHYAQKAIETSPKLAIACKVLAENYSEMKKYDSSILYWKKLIDFDTSITYKRRANEAVIIGIAQNYLLMNQTDSFEAYFEKLLKIENNSCLTDSLKLARKNSFQGLAYWRNKQYEEAINYELICVGIRRRSFFNSISKKDWADFCDARKTFNSEQLYQYIESRRKNCPFDLIERIFSNYFTTALCYFELKDLKNALKFAEESLVFGLDKNNFENIFKDSEVKNSFEFKALIKKYFPEKK